MLGIGLGYSRGGAAAAATPWYEGQSTLPSSSGSATVTADPTAHTKGAYTEIIASNAAETSVLTLTVTDTFASNTNTSTLVDIAVGASGSETIIAADIAIGGAVTINDPIFAVLPVRVPSGSRLSARIQSVVTGGKTATIALSTFALGNASTVPTSVDILGTSTATSAGTQVTTAYTEIVASTSTAYKAIGVIESFSSSVATSATDVTMTVAVGAASSEVDIHQKFIWESSSEFVATSGRNPFYITDVDVPAGSRISVKTSTSDQWACVIGVPA